MKNKERAFAQNKKRNTEKYSQYRTGGQEHQKPKNFKSTAKRLLRMLKNDRIAVTFVVIIGAVSAFLSVLGPKYLGDIMDLINEQVAVKLSGGSINLGKISSVLLTIFLIYLISGICTFVIHFIMAGVTQRLITDLRGRINKKLSRLPLLYFDNSNKGDLLSRVTNDIDNINNTFQNSFVHSVNAIVTFFGVLFIMLWYNRVMTAAALSPLPFGALIALGVLSVSKRYFRKQWQVTGDINGHIEEMFTGHNIVKAFGREKQAIEEFEEINEELYEVSRKAQFYSGFLGPLINFANNLGYVLICMIGGYLIINGGYNIGAITVFMFYSKLFMQPLVDMSNIVNELQSSLASAERVFELVDEEEEVPDTVKTTIEKSAGSVEIENICFSYKKDVPLIENFSLDVKPGQLIAIVGPTGAGKTTLVNLLMRFYEIQSGSIKIDGTDIRDISRKNLHNIFSMVLQDTWLFKGSIRDNILYGHENATEEEFENAVRTARVDRFVSTFPDGFDTVLEEDGENLSAGQRQLITIARAVLKNPDILILDEATSNVDTRTELQIQKAMNALMKGRTSFVIAHRLSTIREADMILFVDDGKITEKGTHEQLLEKNGDYAELYYSQFAGRRVTPMAGKGSA